MNTKQIILSCAVLTLGITAGLTAQTSTSEYTKKLVSIKEVKRTEQPAKKTEGYAYTKRMPANYSGFVIELTESELPLRKDHPDFLHFGKVYYDKTRTGIYSYFILADFSRRDSAEEYLHNVVRPRVPAAKIKEYLHGKRKDKKPAMRKFRYMPD